MWYNFGAPDVILLFSILSENKSITFGQNKKGLRPLKKVN